jgi:uncharacterized protein (DUF342 family)
VSKERITIRVSEDGMCALADVARGPRGDARDLAAALERAAIRFGVNESARQRLIDGLGDPDFAVRDVLLASGTPAVARRDVAFEPAFATGLQPGTLRQDGSMDFFDRGLLKSVVEGDVLGRVRPASAGSPGVRVDGGTQAIAHAAELLPRFGPGVELQEDGSVIARRSGVLEYCTQEALDVAERHVHRGDVDMRSGHLSLEGSLEIAGDVKRMFGVRALGDLEIRGGVEGGSVYAGGDIRIHAGLSGGDGGIVSAGGDLRAHHAERATLVCGGALTLEESVHCELTAETIQVLRWLRGGTATAELSITAEQAGSPHSNTATLLIAGVPLDPPELPSYPLIVQVHHETVSEPTRASGRPVSMSSLVMRASGHPTRNSAPPPHLSTVPTRVSTGPRAAVGASQQAPAMPRGRDDEAAVLEAARSTVQHERSPRLLALASIHIFGTAHAGVTVQIGESRLVLEQPMHNVCFSFDPHTRKIVTTNARR